MRNRPAIACVNHATAEVVDAAVGQLRRIARGDFAAPVILPVPPQVYENETLCSRSQAC